MITAILVAAGRGTRMGPGVDKLFLELAGRPVVAHAWQRFDDIPLIDEIVLVVRDGMQAEFRKLAEQFGFRKPWRLCSGGAERQDSVWNGIQAASPQTEIVVIQDAARPCTPASLIVDTISAARKIGAAVAAQKVTDTIKESDDGKLINRTIDRSKLWAVQTPQTFRIDIIRRALAAVRQAGGLVTDDTAACEQIGQPVQLVECKTPNPKVTSPADLPFIQMLIQN